ncbi:hypothetical protein [Aureimonas sp. AU12]|uniref:hypothetical protein n=1 Tax=Aureimonas sp. AU12 TaxID=1638161 RepID=UPI000781EF29|nr:hypothetical protein [Aureimonas sp. AU12]
MVARAGTGQQSMNAGELSPELAGRVDIKQYYSAGLRFLNIEPVAQAGFRNIGGTRAVRPTETPWRPRFWRLKQSRSKSFLIAVVPFRIDIFEGTVLRAQIATGLTPEMAAECSLYLEGDTVGIFHRNLRSLRLLRRSDTVWELGDWPYSKIPEQDYGAGYPKTNDVWNLWIRWAQGDTANAASISLTVDGETIATQTTALPVQSANAVVWKDLADRLQAELQALPSLGPGVTVTPAVTGPGFQILDVVFGGALSGVEYQLTAQVVNTASVSVLPSHTGVGKTGGEPLISDGRGWPGVVSIVQDRLVYANLNSRPSALLMSQTAEYFNINTKAQRDDGAKLEALRTNSAEEILHVKSSQYLLVFTDEAEYFATNREVKRTDPLNFVETGRNGLTPGTWPEDIENRVYFVGQRGGVLFSTAYDDLSSAFTARQESLLASHLIDDVVMTALQRGTDDTDAPRLWLLRGDGRLIGASIIRDQDITAFFEYDVGDPIRSIGVDADNNLWLAVDRPYGQYYEILEPSSYLVSAIGRTSNADGFAFDLPHADGTQVWIETYTGYTDGPYVVTSGFIRTPYRSTGMSIGRWVPPRWQSMPRVLVTRNDQVVRRPGRIHTVKANILGTMSIAIGANNTPPRDVALLRTSDPTDQPMAAKTQLVTVAGIPGVVEDTTAVITQTRPGPLRVRDLTFEEKL